MLQHNLIDLNTWAKPTQLNLAQLECVLQRGKANPFQNKWSASHFLHVSTPLILKRQSSVWVLFLLFGTSARLQSWPVHYIIMKLYIKFIIYVYDIQ